MDKSRFLNKFEELIRLGRVDVVGFLAGVCSLVLLLLVVWGDGEPRSRQYTLMLAFIVASLLYLMNIPLAFRNPSIGKPRRARLVLKAIHASFLAVAHEESQVENVRLRITLLKVENEHFLQVTDYVGHAGGGKGRKFRVDSGISGSAVEKQVSLVASCLTEDKEEFVSEMINLWKYKQHEAEKLNQEARSWMAIPFFYNEQQYVLFADVNKTDFFKQLHVALSNRILLATFKCDIPNQKG